MLRITETEFRLLRDLIERECGIYLTENKTYLIETRLCELVQEYKCATFGDLYLQAMSSNKSGTICAKIVDAITTNETSWFRDNHPYQTLKERLLPEYYKEVREGKRRQISFWSAGCSTGQEPYSVALVILDFFNAAGSDSVCHNWTRILATDISQASLALAIAGKYDNTSINRGLPEKYLAHYFQKKDNSWVLDEQVKRMVSFRQYNLKDPLVGLGLFDIVFLRNVLIYFSDALKRDIFERISRTMAPGGFLFLGTGETVSGYSSAFETVNSSGSMFYRLRQSNRS
jgi:chemotaxis protein methyltransferase CheR